VKVISREVAPSAKNVNMSKALHPTSLVIAGPGRLSAMQYPQRRLQAFVIKISQETRSWGTGIEIR
jgi:hypothetical protein